MLLSLMEFPYKEFTAHTRQFLGEDIGTLARSILATELGMTRTCVV